MPRRTRVDFVMGSDDGDCHSSRYTYSSYGKKVIVGICAMEKKSLSKPMREILDRLKDFDYISTIIFPEETILVEPVERWPLCDCLIAFDSTGFPLNKAVEYTKLRKPYIINNLEMQFEIQDRRQVYAILEREGIALPRYAILDRDDETKNQLIEHDDHVEVNGVVFNKPFVEKPISAEDHNIYMYYPTSAGGGSQRLFRKIGSRSSVYSSESGVRKTGSYIYEDFMPTDGTDVKVYTVGPDYAHAEARKSPALDGKVERDSEGKEVRYPVILSNKEKLIARKVCMAFKQMVCGFDLLRANGKSIVCDVNGFSFVKNSSKYYDDCAKILGNMILRELAPTLHIPWTMPFQLDDPPIVPTTVGKMMELRCVVGIIRHGDRTPKQKLKLEVKHPKFFEIFKKYDGFKENSIKLKKPQQLQEILDVARFLLDQINIGTHEAVNIEEKKTKLEQIKSVLEMYGHFSGINRKIQLKYQAQGRPRNSTSTEDASPREASLLLILKWGGELTPSGRMQAEELGKVFRCMYPGGQDLLIGGLPQSKIDEKKKLDSENRNTESQQHDCLSECASNSSNNINGEYAGTQGLGLLRLHSTYRHDLKIYASDEGRVQMTAAAFAKGLLALEGELTPILVQMVKSANTNGLLDNDSDCSSKYQNIRHKVPRDELHTCHKTPRKRSSESKTDDENETDQHEPSQEINQKEHQLESLAEQNANITQENFDPPELPNYFNSLDENNRLQFAKESVKSKLHDMMQQDKTFDHEDEERLNPCHQISISNAMKVVRNPVRCCRHIHNLIQKLNLEIKEKRKVLEDSALYHGETWELIEGRWTKLEKDFISKNGTFDISKVPDIYDCIKYDLQHNRNILQSEPAEELYKFAKNMADVVIPQEYGMTKTEKLTIAQGICAPLLRKIRADLQRNIEAESEEDEEMSVNRLNPRYSSGVSSPGRHVRTRLYFTSESHIHSLLTVLSTGGLVDNKDEQWQRAMEYVSLVSELNYMTQVVIMLYEDPTKDPSSDERFHVELHFSPGVNCCVQKDLPPGPGFRPHSRNQEQQGNHSSEQSYDGTTDSEMKQSSLEEDSNGKGNNDELKPPAMTPLSASKSSPILSSSNSSIALDPLEVFSPDASMVSSSIKDTSSAEASHSTMTDCKLLDSRSDLIQRTDPIPIVNQLNVEFQDQVLMDECIVGSLDNILDPKALERANSTSSMGSNSKRSKSLEKKSSRPKSLDTESTNGNDDSSVSGRKDESCQLSKAQSMDDVGDEEGFKRSHRHSIPSHRLNNYIKFLHELAAKGSTSAQLFSTAVISGSSSAPNLNEVPQPAIEGTAISTPGIRPLETLHNSLSLRQLDSFLGFFTLATFKSGSSTGGEFTPSKTSSQKQNRPPPLSFTSRDSSVCMWSGPPSFVSSCETSPAHQDLIQRIRQFQENSECQGK